MWLVLPRVISPHRGGLRREVSLSLDSQEDQLREQVEDRATQRPFSAGDLEETSAEFTCSEGARREVNPAAQPLEWAPVDLPALGPDHERL